MLTSDGAGQARTDREADKLALVEALVDAGLLKPASGPGAELSQELAAAIHAFVARSPSLLAVAQIDDLAGERTAINLPGTDQERPNWRRRIGAPLDELLEGPLAKAILAAMRAARGGGGSAFG